MILFFFSSRRRHTRLQGDWSSDVCSSDLDELDVVVDEVRVEVLDLLLRQLDVVETINDLVVREEPLVSSIGDELLELFGFGERDLDGEQVGDLRLVLNDVVDEPDIAEDGTHPDLTSSELGS